MNVPGYESLARVLEMAYNQAAIGKGVERHAKGQSFDRQVMQTGADQFGVGALLFQAFKKSEESQRLDHDRAINELLGAICYLAGAVIAMERKEHETKMRAREREIGKIIPCSAEEARHAQTYGPLSTKGHP